MAITTGPALPELRGLRLHTRETLPDIAHETYKAEATIEYTYAATAIQSCSVRENAAIIPSTFKEAMCLLAKAKCKSRLGQGSGTPEEEQRLHPPAGDFCPRRTQDFRQAAGWVDKVMTDNSQRTRYGTTVGWGQLPGVDCGSAFSPISGLQSTHRVLAVAAEYYLECWHIDYNTAFLNTRCHRGSVLQDGTRTREIRRTGSPTGNDAFGINILPPPEHNKLVEHHRRTSGRICFKRLKPGPCVYAYPESGAIYVLTLYVDDVLLLRNGLLMERRVNQKQTSRPSMTNTWWTRRSLSGRVLPMAAIRGRWPPLRRNTPGPCWSSTLWQAAIQRTHLVWLKSCRWTTRRRGA